MVVSICALLLIVLLMVGICCVARQRRQKGVDHHEKGDVPLEAYYNIGAGGNTEDAEVNHTTAGYTYISTNSPSSEENEDQIAPYASVSDLKGSRDRLNNSRDRLTASNDKLNTSYAMLNAAADEVGNTEVIENEHTADYDDAVQGTSDTQPATHSEHGEKRQSAEYTVIPAVPHLTTRTPPLSSQEYATIPDKEPAEGLYDTADNVPQNEGTEATPPAANYASIVEPSHDDTEQPPPVPAFDPEILYTPPDKTSKSNGGHAAVGDYEPVGMPHASAEPVRGADNTERQPKEPGKDTGDAEQPPQLPAFDPEILYTQPDKTSKPKDGGYETIQDTPGPATVGDYEPVAMPRTNTETQPKVPSPTRAHHGAPDFGYDTIPDPSGPVADGDYEAVDIPRTNTAATREAEAKKLSDKPTAARPGELTGSIYETIPDSTLSSPVDVASSYEAIQYPPNPHPAQGRTPPVQPSGSDAIPLYAEPERAVEQRAAKDKADGYATVDDTSIKGSKPKQTLPAADLYSTPDLSQKMNRRRESQGSVGGEGPKDTPPVTPTAIAKDKSDGYATVDELWSKGARKEQPLPADTLYSTPDMSQKRDRRTGSQGSLTEEGPKDTPPGTPTAEEQLYTTPDMSKKQRKQSHMSNGTPTEEQQGRDDDEDDDTPPEVPEYQPITSLPGVNSK